MVFLEFLLRQIVIIAIGINSCLDACFVPCICCYGVNQPLNRGCFLAVPVSLRFFGLNVLNNVQFHTFVFNSRIFQLTSDLVQRIPTLDNSARLASSKTLITPASVVALPIWHTANISSHFSKYRSVMLRRAEFRSRSPMQWDLLRGF
jgi:hypothetical protein